MAASLEQVYQQRAALADRYSFQESWIGDRVAADGHRMRAVLYRTAAQAAHYGDWTRADGLARAAEGDEWGLDGLGVTLRDVLDANGMSPDGLAGAFDGLGWNPFKAIKKAADKVGGAVVKGTKAVAKPIAKVVKPVLKPIQKATKYVVKGNPVSQAISKATPSWISKPLKAVARPVLATSAAIVTGGASIAVAHAVGGKKDQAYLGIKPAATGFAAGAIIGGAVLAAPLVVPAASAVASGVGAAGSAVLGAAGGAAALLPPAVGLAGKLLGGGPAPAPALPVLDLAPPGPVTVEPALPTPEQIDAMQRAQSSNTTLLVVGGVALAGLAALALTAKPAAIAATAAAPRAVAGYDRPRRRRKRAASNRRRRAR